MVGDDLSDVYLFFFFSRFTFVSSFLLCLMRDRVQLVFLILQYDTARIYDMLAAAIWHGTLIHHLSSKHAPAKTPRDDERVSFLYLHSQ